MGQFRGDANGQDRSQVQPMQDGGLMRSQSFRLVHCLSGCCCSGDEQSDGRRRVSGSTCQWDLTFLLSLGYRWTYSRVPRNVRQRPHSLHHPVSYNPASHNHVFENTTKGSTGTSGRSSAIHAVQERAHCVGSEDGRIGTRRRRA